MKFPALVEVLSQTPGNGILMVRVRGEVRAYVLADSEKWRIIRALSVNQPYALKMLERFERSDKAEQEYKSEQAKAEEAAILDAMADTVKIRPPVPVPDKERKGKRK